MIGTKKEAKSYTKVTRFYFRACSPYLQGFVNQQLLSGNDRNRDTKTNDNFRNKGECYE